MGKPEILKITFEFSSKLGVRELPKIDKNHESNVPGLYVVGDLADAPIIKVALNQGYETAQHVVSTIGDAVGSDEDVYDAAVIGAGPAGIGAALALEEAGARYVVLEKERPFNSIQNFPKAKLIFSEPREMQNRGNFWFEDAQKEELIERWDQALEKKALRINQPEEVVDARKEGGLFHVVTQAGDQAVDSEGGGRNRDERPKKTYRARKVILAIGRRASVTPLKAPGEGLEKVRYSLRDPKEHAGRKVLVAGGGDSAVEAAIACAEAGAETTISYRRDAFTRAKLQNRLKIEDMVKQGKIRAEYGTMPVEVREDAVVLERAGNRFEVPNDDVLVFFGTKLPKGFLRKLGLRMEGDMHLGRVLWILSFAFITYLFYVLKNKMNMWPFGEGHLFAQIPELLKVDLGFRTVDGGFWGTVIYSLVILIFGVRGYLKYPSKLQKRRYVSLVVFQMVFLFGIPELLAPFIIDRPWKVYAVTVPWPLGIWGLIDAPSWTPDGQTLTAVLWILAGAIASFVLIPLYVRKNGERFCSYLCGCGGMAETLGDFWRHLAPRGSTSYKTEWFGRAVLILAIPVTLLILNDAWAFFAAGALYDAKAFAQHWYGLMVDFWLAAVVGVALYPYLGNRVWCRFFCPLRAYMEILSRKFSRIAIKANEKCIGCGECTRYCQMGIDVQSFAQRQETFHNGNSACIQCGICIQVCPMDVLDLGQREIGKNPIGMAPAGHQLAKVRAAQR